MRILFLLHFYQPASQQKDILDRIVHECYLPVTKGLLTNPRYKIIVNITGALTELLIKNGYKEVIDNLKKLGERGQIEFTASAKYHAFLPLLSEDEITRQILSNEEINKKYFGKGYSPIGFFPPEMAVNQKVLAVASKLGYQWIACPELAKEGSQAVPDKLYQEEKYGLMTFFRNKRASSLVLSAVSRTSEDLIKETQDIHNDKYWFCVMDAETFGHHRIGYDKVLLDILNNPFFEPTLVRDLLVEHLPIEKIQLRPSTWTNEEQDFWLDKEKTKPTEAKSFILWQDPANPIHKYQWFLTKLAIKCVHDLPNKESPRFKKARNLLDRAISSDQYWWASAKPWWSLEMIEQGAFALKKVVECIDKKGKDAQKAQMLYQKIMDQAFTWQRTGYIRETHLKNSGTFMREPFKKRAPAEWYNQTILEFEDEMNKAAAKQDFEKAIKWRDALIKLKNETDPFDVLHVVDELWSARNIPQVKPFLEHDWEEFSGIAREGFVNAKNKEEFEDWKKAKK